MSVEIVEVGIDDLSAAVTVNDAVEYVEVDGGEQLVEVVTVTDVDVVEVGVQGPPGTSIDDVVFSSLIGDGSSTEITVSHGFGSSNIVVGLYTVDTMQRVYCDIVVTSTEIVLSFSSAPAVDEYKLVAVGGNTDA